jgi:hypothetical protein
VTNRGGGVGSNRDWGANDFVSETQALLVDANLPSCETIFSKACYPWFGSQKGATMRWYHYVAYFFGGAFLANTLPHLENGISGHAFQSPFASPPGIGLSSSMVNVLWGLFNLAVGYLLVCRVGSFNLRKTQHVLVLGAGILIMSLMLARAFGRFYGGL